MSSISSITKAVSGLKVAQQGLQVTAHNISNTNTEGYTRQHLLQSDSGYLTVGKNGGLSMQVGLGVSSDEIRQIRDQLADKRFRTESSVLNYYQKLNSTTNDITTVFDEPYGDTISDLLNTFWSQAQKLSTDPDGVEERMSFISTAQVLASKINVVTNSLSTLQTKLNSDLTTSVNRVNEILQGIADYNLKISMAESGTENANDYRDARNLLLDELSQYGDIEYYEQADHQVCVSFEGWSVVDKQIVTKMELRQTEEGSPFKEPVWKDTKKPVFNLDKEVSSAKNEDTGIIKAILIARGDNVVDSETTWNDIAFNDNLSVDVEGNSYLIPKIQKMLNDFTSYLTGIVNDNFKGTGIGIHEGKQGVPVFVATNVPGDVFDAAGKFKYNLQDVKDKIAKGDFDNVTAEELEAYNAYLIGGNVEVNPSLLADGGYNLLGTVSKAPDGSDDQTKQQYAANVSDNTLVQKFLGEFNSTKTWYDRATAPKSAPVEKSSKAMDFFSELVTDIGTKGNLYTSKASEKTTSVTNITNERQAMGGVSTDEEFTSMLKYQYAYNASSRMITMLDGMLDTIINKM